MLGFYGVQSGMEVGDINIDFVDMISLRTDFRLTATCANSLPLVRKF